MKIRAPLHSMDARGRFGVGFVFSIWKGMSTARVFSVPVNPRSSRQMVIRALLTSASRAWAALTDANRDAWDAWALLQNRKNIFGQDQKVSGYNEYCSLSVLAADVGETPVSSPPADPAPVMVTDGAIAEGAAGGEIDVTWTAGQDGFVDVWATGVLPVGRQPRESDYRHLAYVADATESYTIEGLIGGSLYGVRIRQVAADGQSGPWIGEVLEAKTAV